MINLTQLDAKRRKPVEEAKRCRSPVERHDRGIPSEDDRRGTPLDGSSETFNLVGQKRAKPNIVDSPKHTRQSF